MYKSAFQISENNPIFIITSLKRRGLRLRGGISFHSSQIFKSGWSELMNIETEWAAACTCKCLIFGPFFSILGTLEWEIACLPHLGLFTATTHGSISYMCLLGTVLADGKGTVPVRKQIIFIVLTKAGMEWFLLAAKERVSWCLEAHWELSTINGALFAVWLSAVLVLFQTHFLL